MKLIHGFFTTSLCSLSLVVGLIASLAAEGDNGAELETRAYALGGYIPKFHDDPRLRSDPFNETDFEEHKKKVKEHEQGIVSYLKQNGIEARKIKFIPEFNSLLLTDTRDKLEMYEVMLRCLFRPDMQLRAIDKATRALADRKILDGDQLSRVGFLDDITFRAFHNEVRKLESELEDPPENNQERKVIVERLRIAKEYREEAIKLYLKSLEEQKALIERWQKTNKPEQGSPVRPAAPPDSKPQGDQNTESESEGRAQ